MRLFATASSRLGTGVGAEQDLGTVPGAPGDTVAVTETVRIPMPL